MKKYEKGEIAEIILSTLLIAGFMTIAVTMPNAVQLFKYFTPKNAYDRERIKRSVARLKKSGYIEPAISNSELYELTSTGREKAMQYAIGNMKIPIQKNWDKKWRLIMFDVPENKKQERRAMNFALKKIGCIQYQKSVFITPFQCKKEIDFVGSAFDIRRYVRIVTADDVEQVGALKKTFKI